MAPGFLAVLSEPGNQVSLDEFQDWYDNEHIPLRLNHLPSFLSGARYQSIDGIQPSWIAVYEIDDTNTFGDPSYTVLRETRSQREADLIGRLGVLDRRICEVVGEAGEDDDDERTTGFRVGNPSRWVVTHGIGRPPSGGDEDIKEEAVGKWLDEVVTKLKNSSVEGWVHTRVFKVLESGKTGVDLPVDEEEVLSHFVLHEFISEESANSASFREIIEKHGSQLSLQFSEFRRWELYNAYPCVAQGNLPSTTQF